MGMPTEEVLGKDIALLHDLDMGIAGEGKVAIGRDCLAQDLIHALTTSKGSLRWHLAYGVDIIRYLKMPNTGTNRLALEQEIRLTVEEDPRVELGSVRIELREWDLNVIHFKVVCTPITEKHPLNLVFDYGLYDSSGKVVAT